MQLANQTQNRTKTNKPSGSDERPEARVRASQRRAVARDLVIPAPKNPERRLKALRNPFELFDTYFSEIFYEEWTQDRIVMVSTIIDAAVYGGDQAIAGPRGEGKTRIAIYTALYLMLKNLSRFPVVVGKSQGSSSQELKSLREKLQQSQTFLEDFPEIGVPFRAVGGWSSRARMQTVCGDFTNIEIGSSHLIFPTIGLHQVADDWPADVPLCSNGQTIAALGIDGQIRGTSYRDQRPTIAIIDDIEDREAASSNALIDKNKDIIDKDIAGLGASARRISRVMLCTIQNRRCIAFMFTDPVRYSSWRGMRFRKMIKPPERMDLVQQYIDMRRARTEDDRDGRNAFEFWQKNKEVIEAGCVVSNKNSFDNRLHADGKPLELSAIHAYYNRVADVGEEAVATEIDNDPPEETGPTGIGIDVSLVENRINGLTQRVIPVNTLFLTTGIDLGKYRCHWVTIAWQDGAKGYIVDYGVGEVTGTGANTTTEASLPQIYKCLLEVREDFNATQYLDPTGQVYSSKLVFVDSGAFTDVAYQFCKDVRGPYQSCKGVFPYRTKEKGSADVRIGDHLHASYLQASRIWLYDLDTHYWKSFVHEMFLTPTFAADGMVNRASLSLYKPEGTHKHSTFAQHIVAEELVHEFQEGKGDKSFWLKRNRNNHYLDATYMACAAASVLGMRLLPQTQEQKEITNGRKTKPQQSTGNRVVNRPGPWVRPKRQR
jgi:hypothetical protein